MTDELMQTNANHCPKCLAMTHHAWSARCGAVATAREAMTAGAAPAIARGERRVNRAAKRATSAFANQLYNLHAALHGQQ
jgi:hypothetical protein